MNYITKELSAKSHLLVSLLAVAGIGSSVTAQTADSTLVREMLIEKEYIPVVKDADKIVRMPAVEAPVTNKTRIVHSNPAFKMDPVLKIDNLQSGDIGTGYEFNKERAYINAGYGNYNDILFDKGFKFVDTDNNRLGLILNLNSVSGKLKSNQTGEKSRMRNLNSLIDLFYNHKGSKLMFSSDIKLGWNDFSYYGGAPGYLEVVEEYGNLPIVLPSENTAPISYLGERLSRYGADFRIDSRNTEKWEYEAFLSGSRLGYRRSDFSEFTLHLGGKLSRLISEDWKLTGDVDLRYLFYTDAPGLKNSGLSSFKAYFDYVNAEKISFKGGLVLDVSTGLSPHLTVAPYIDFKWNVSDMVGVYSSIKGGMKQYSYNEETNYVRFFDGGQTRNSYTPFDFNVGIKIAPVQGLQFDIAGNIDYTINQRFYQSYLYASYYSYDLDDKELPSGVLRESIYYNRIHAYTANSGRYSLKGSVRYNYGKTFDIGFSIKGNAYSVKDDKTPSYMPKMELAANIAYKPIKKLTFNLDYDLKTRHDAVVVYPVAKVNNEVDPFEIYTENIYKNVSLKNISMLDFKTTYSFTNNFSVFGKIDNILNNKSDVWYGMPSMGIRFMGGVNWSF